MHSSFLLTQRAFLATMALTAPLLLIGQLLGGLDTQRGGGVLQTCDSSMHVDFLTERLDGYVCQFTPVVDPGATQVNSSIWHYYDGVEWAEAIGSPTVPYFGPEPYPVCLTVDAFDLEASQPCSTTVCKVVTPLPYAMCGQLVADFTVGSVSGTSVTFVNQSVFPGGQIAGAYWSFGDGTSISAGLNPSHDFVGGGPFQVCLTVLGAPPTECYATRCKWFYMGPGDLECAQLVSQGFAVLQYNELVGVLDTSLTSGMDARIDWDFGDGATAQGLIALHAYEPFQTYELCGTLRVWGPLLPDTCLTTLCREVHPMPAVGIAERLTASGIIAWPSPFDDVLHLAPLRNGGRVALLDGLGRAVMERRIAASTQATLLPVGSLPPGCYTLLLYDGDERRTQRLVKQP